MYYFWVLLFLFSTHPVKAQEAASISDCRPPSEHLFKEKLKKWFHTEKLEKELRDVIASTPNYERREAIKSHHRGTYFADRLVVAELHKKIQNEFQGMITAEPHRVGPMADFPVRGAASELSSGDDGTLQIRSNSIPLADQGLLSPEIRAKLGDSIKVSYHYPIDRYDYSLTYEGAELPFEDVIAKIQNDYEMDCTEFKNRQKEYLENKQNSSGALSY